MHHGQVYQMALSNYANTRCDVSVLIDGMNVGSWRIPPANTIVLERPANQEGRFTFFRVGSPEALAAAVSESEETGWILATFTPEAESKGLLFEPEENEADDDFAAGRGTPDDPGDIDFLAAAAPKPVGDAGGTELSGRSEQVFGEAGIRGLRRTWIDTCVACPKMG